MASAVEFEYAKMDDAELIKLLRNRKLPIPAMENGFLNKKEAADLLRKYDRQRVDESERVWVTFHESSHPSAGPYVYASVNEKDIQVPYGVKVCIPKYFLTECIDRAIVTEYEQQDIPGVGIKTRVRKIPTYPYTNHGPATEDEAMDAIRQAGRSKRGKLRKEAAGLSGEEISKAV